MKLERYPINIFYSDEDRCFVADVSDLEHCSAFGASPEEALAELRVAMGNWLAAARKLGLPVPKPTYRPATYQAR